MSTVTEQAPEGDRLNGWKEIAAYLNKSVSSVQRWERELKLPVRRLKTPEGQIVSASRREIDAWRSALEQGSLLEGTGHETEEHPETHGVAERAPKQRPWRLWSIVAAVLLAVTGLSWQAAWRRPPAVSTGADLFLVGRSLEARDPTGAVVWSYPFDSEVSSPNSASRGETGPAGVLSLDLDGDGGVEFVVPVRRARPGMTSESSDVLYAFTRTGRLLWSVTPTQRFTCGGKELGEPWAISAVLPTGEPGRPRIWVAFVHSSSWPSFVMEIAPDGAASTRYVQTGWIMSLAEVATGTGHRLAVGGVIHPEDRPSVVFVDPTGRSSMNPNNAPGFACEGLPTAPPDQVTLLPNGEVGQAGGHPYLMVDSLRLRSGLEAEIGSDLIVHFDKQMPTDVVFSDIYWKRHRDLEAAGKLSHSAARCPEAGPQEVRIWTAASGWSRQLVPSASRALDITR